MFFDNFRDVNLIGIVKFNSARCWCKLVNKSITRSLNIEKLKCVVLLDFIDFYNQMEEERDRRRNKVLHWVIRLYTHHSKLSLFRWSNKKCNKKVIGSSIIRNQFKIIGNRMSLGMSFNWKLL